jgi:uncharacterized protein DUF6152
MRHFTRILFSLSITARRARPRGSGAGRRGPPPGHIALRRAIGREYNPGVERRILSIAVVCVLFGTATRAHHSISGIYDDSQRKTIEGVVTELHFINPHPFVMTAVKDGNGAAQPWRLEMDNRHELAAIGFTSETLKPGDHIVVTGSLARRQARSLYIRRLDRLSDGFWYEQVGATPRIRPRSQ